MKKYAVAEKLAAAGLDGFMSVELPSKAEIKAMPKATADEKAERKAARELYSDMKNAKKAAGKYYPDGITEFDMSVFEKLFAAEDKNEAALEETAKRLKALKTAKMPSGGVKEEYASLRSVKKEIAAEIKKATEYNSVYHRAAKPYIDAVNTVKQKNSYDKFDISGLMM